MFSKSSMRFDIDQGRSMLVKEAYPHPRIDNLFAIFSDIRLIAGS
jgi:hypothetical protein